jgi:ssDNA thymidine ADP-ribosyltransferase, DarT
LIPSPLITPAEEAARRGVTELVHYTTQKGVHGTIASKAILSRARLDKDEYLEHIREPVWPRKDPAWVDHISLSITSINDDLFFRSRVHYPHLWWAVFSLSPGILDDDEVVFTTTNNIYPAVRRGHGIRGFGAMFADPVTGRYGRIHTRAGLPASQPTDRAAEVLYPALISTEHLQAVYVMEPDHKYTVLGWCEALDHPDLAVEIRPDIFS